MLGTVNGQWGAWGAPGWWSHPKRQRSGVLQGSAPSRSHLVCVTRGGIAMQRAPKRGTVMETGPRLIRLLQHSPAFSGVFLGASDSTPSRATGVSSRSTDHQSQPFIHHRDVSAPSEPRFSLRAPWAAISGAATRPRVQGGDRAVGVLWQPARPWRSKLSTSLLSPVRHKNPSLLHLAPLPSEQQAAGGTSTIARGSTAPGTPKHVLLFGQWGQIFFQVHPLHR